VIVVLIKERLPRWWHCSSKLFKQLIFISFYA